MEALLQDSGSFMLVIIGVVAVCLLALGFVLFGDDRSTETRKRMRKLDPKQKAREAKRNWSPFGAAEQSARDRLQMLADEQKTATESTSLRQKLEQAGVKSSPAQYLLYFYLFAALVGGAVFVYFGNGLAAAGAGAVCAFLVPTMWIRKSIEKRVGKFLEIFPNALDILVRGVRSGLPVNESLRVAAHELPDPVGEELRTVVAEVNMGVPLEEALRKMAGRVPSPDVNFFRTVLAIQKQTGGNLAEALSNLSNILRERRKMKKKITALSSEARMSAIIIGSLPIIVGVLVYLMKPDYIMLLFTEELGQYMAAGGAFWMLCGILIMRWMVKFEI